MSSPARQSMGVVIDFDQARAARQDKAAVPKTLHAVACHYDEEIVHFFHLSDNELKDMLGVTGSLHHMLFELLQQARPDLRINQPGKFDYVIKLGG